jgi:tRNA(Glu) U13 pseudouridine synthase TruD
MLRGSHSIFAADLDDELITRYRQLDISSTASLYGAGPEKLTAEPRLIEAQVFTEHGDITHCLDQQGAKLQMRPLRAAVDDLSFDYDVKAQSLFLELRLPTGCYVTTLLDHFMSLQDAS